MSHDRKPGRVRVMKAGGGSTQRRRRDGAAVVIDGTARGRAGKGKGKSEGGARGRVMPIALFLVAAIGSAVAVTLYLPS